MPQKTHYSDDLFVLSTMVKGLDASLAVEADPEYFRDKIAGNIFFIDSTIRTFSGLLEQNAHLIERAEYAKLLKRTSRTFMGILKRLMAQENGENQPFAAYFPQFKTTLEGQEKVESSLEAILSSSLDGASESDLVSQDELSELLR